MSLNIEVDVDALAPLADGIRAAPDAIVRAQLDGINVVADRVNQESRRRIVSTVNLSPTYVRDRMRYVKAKRSTMKAGIFARVRPTTLATFGAQQLVQPAPKAKGDKLRGIPAGQKQAGVSVMVKPASRKAMRKAFLVPLRNVGRMGVFTRFGPEKKDILHRYGPSVDQVFRNVAGDMEPDIIADLDREISNRVYVEVAAGIGRG